MNFDQITEPLDRRLADGLTRLAAVARQLDWQAAEAAGLSPNQADILRFVATRPEGARLTAAAAHAGVRKATASDAVAALERKALARKHAGGSPTGRRHGGASRNVKKPSRYSHTTSERRQVRGIWEPT